MPFLHTLRELYTDLTGKRIAGLSRSEFKHLLYEILSKWRQFHNGLSEGDNSVSTDPWSTGDDNSPSQNINELVENVPGDRTDKSSYSCFHRDRDVAQVGVCPVLEDSRHKCHVLRETMQHGTKDCKQITSDLCKKETLILLTCIKVLLEPEAGGKDNDGEEEGTEDTGSRTTSAVNSQLIEELVETDILSGLLNFLDVQDKFISFAASKAVIAAMRCDFLHEGKESLLKDILMKATNRESSTGAPFLDILKHFMSNRSGEKTNTWCFHALKSSELFMVVFMKNIVTNLDIKSIDRPVTYLTLLRKTVKYVNKLDSKLKQEHLQTLYCPLQDELLVFLIKCLQSVSCTQWRILCKATLDVFNTLLNYGNRLAQLKEIPSLYLKTASRILSVVTPSVLMSMPYVCQYISFGGGTVDGIEVQKQSGDLALLRKVIILFLKSCAILSKETFGGDRQQISTCLSSLPKLIMKTFPSSPPDFEWLPLVFADQDDSWVETLLCLLDIYLNSQRGMTPSVACSQTSPHAMFLQFLKYSSNDHMVIVDLLTSPETCFLLYFIRYLKCVSSEWKQFMSACHREFPCEQSAMKYFGSLANSREALEPSVISHQETLVNTDRNSSCSPVVKKIKLNSSCSEKKVMTKEKSAEYVGVSAASGLTERIYLTAYSDSDSSSEDNSSFSSHVTSESKPVSISPCSTMSKEVCENKLASFSQTDCISSLTCSNLPQGGSTMSCDLQCVEHVMDTLIRVRLRVEKLSEQKLFPYNPDPLLLLLDECETLYEEMGSCQEHQQ